MEKWILEPGHTAVEFRVRHMMITLIRGHIKDVHGEVFFDLENPREISFSVKMDLKNLSTGEPARDAHLLSEDFLYAEKYPLITFESRESHQTGAKSYKVLGDLTVRGVKKEVVFPIEYQGRWKTLYHPESGDPFSVMRIGFTGSLILNRRDFGIDWNAEMENGGLVVGDEISLDIDAEALSDSDLKGLC